MIKEFKQFAMRGNVLDMAVGIIIGGAFGKIVSSFVADVIMPPIGVLLGGVDFSGLKLTVKGASVNEAGEVVNAVLVSYIVSQKIDVIFRCLLVITSKISIFSFFLIFA